MRLWVLALLVSGFACALWSCSGRAQQPVPVIRDSDWPPAAWDLAPQIVKTPQQCEVHRCGMPTSSYCSVRCGQDQVANCSCDCTSRALGVCTELKSSCTCDAEPETAWWRF